MSKIEKAIEQASKLRTGFVPAKRQEISTSSPLMTHHQAEAEAPHLRDYLDILMRRKWIVLAFLIPVVITVIIASFLMTPLYKSTTTLHFTNVKNLVKFEDSHSETSNSETQYKIIQSKMLAGRVIAKLPLEKEPSSLDNDAISSFANAVSNLFSSFNKDDTQAVQDINGKRISAGDLISRLEVIPVKSSSLVNLSFESPDPVFAATVANTLADEYIRFAMESKLNPTQQARMRLEKEVDDMRTKLEATEQGLNEYIAKSDLFFINKDQSYETILTQKLSTLSVELNKVIADRISREALYKEVSKSGIDYSVVLDNATIRSLTMEYAKLESEYFNLLQIHKPEYPKMLRLKDQIERLKSRIEVEERKIINTLDSDYQIALKKEVFLSSAIAKLRQEVSSFQGKMVEVQILNREVETNRNLYNSLLERLKEVDVSTALAESNVQVLEKAVVPGSPFKPNKAQNIVLSIIFGLFGGVFLALFVEYFDNSIKTVEDVEKKSRLPVLGTVPFSKVNTGNLVGTKTNGDEVFAESFWSLSTQIKYAGGVSRPRQILITSPLEREGKTLITVNTAKRLSGILGKGVIVDADLRRPNVHNFFNLDNSTGLSSFILGNTEYSELIKKSQYPGLDVITTGPVPSNPSELLNSEAMRELADALSASYDYVIIDSAPVLGLSDSLILSTIADSVILVVKSGETPGEALVQTQKALNNVNANLLGVVLNGVDRKKNYGSLYYYSRYLDDQKLKKLA